MALGRGGDTTDSLICAAGLPISGTAPPMVQPESRTALLTCLGRQMGAHPPAADEARRTLWAKRLESLDDGVLAAPSQVRVVISYRSSSESYPILCDRPLPDAPAGQILPSELGGPRGAESGAQSTPTF